MINRCAALQFGFVVSLLKCNFKLRVKLHHEFIHSKLSIAYSLHVGSWYAFYTPLITRRDWSKWKWPYFQMIQFESPKVFCIYDASELKLDWNSNYCNFLHLMHKQVQMVWLSNIWYLDQFTHYDEIQRYHRICKFFSILSFFSLFFWRMHAHVFCVEWQPQWVGFLSGNNWLIKSVIFLKKKSFTIRNSSKILCIVWTS